LWSILTGVAVWNTKSKKLQARPPPDILFAIQNEILSPSCNSLVALSYSSQVHVTKLLEKRRITNKRNISIRIAFVFDGYIE
jgi:hypothetical protein